MVENILLSRVTPAFTERTSCELDRPSCRGRGRSQLPAQPPAPTSCSWPRKVSSTHPLTWAHWGQRRPPPARPAVRRSAAPGRPRNGTGRPFAVKGSHPLHQRAHHGRGTGCGCPPKATSRKTPRHGVDGAGLVCPVHLHEQVAGEKGRRWQFVAVAALPAGR